jgi:hypothetical protein
MWTSTFVSLALAWTCPEEQQRVRAHLEGAYTQLTTSEPTGLSTTQRQARARALQVLRKYIDRGVYPHNPGHPLTPIFVDASGTRCAMGELLAKLGGHAIVEHVRHTRNLATVGVLADEPGLVEWLTENGLTPEEAALVQPAYSACIPERLFNACGLLSPTMPGAASGLARVGPDGGAIELERLAGTSAIPSLNGSARSANWPVGTTYLWAEASSGGRTLAKRGPAFLSRIDRRCGAPPTLTERDARAIIQLQGEACMRALLALDGRWAVSLCSIRASPPLRRWGDDSCDEEGALRLDSVGSQAAAQTWLDENGFADAGVDLSNYDAWVRERPGPPVLDPIVLEAPPALPLQSGCSEAPGLAVVAMVVSLACTRRRTSPGAVRSR